MAFDRGFLDELTARCDIVDIISRYVQLKRSGSSYSGLCPFHNEKTASFSVSQDKQLYHCFGCGAGGGVINFVMRAEGLGFPDAVRYLAEQVGLRVPEDRADPQAAHRRERVLALCRDTARFYYAQLWAPEHVREQQYFAHRGLTRGIMNRFGLGYAPDSFSVLLDAMQAKGYTKEELLNAGLSSKSERGHIYDRFRNRVMFPIIDTRGQVIAFGGRVMDDSKPKYLNSPETAVFHKSRNLFALNLAKKSKADYFILAEGYMDVIALHQAGFDSAVASLGTSLTEEQARLIARYTKNVVICYDADNAGQAAAQRAIDILKRTELSVKILRIPGAKDPDEFLHEKGSDAFRRLLERSENHIVYRLENIAAKYDLEEDAQRVAFLQDAARELARIDGVAEREVYTGRAAQMAGVSMEAMQVEVKRAMAIENKKRKSAVRHEIRAPLAAAQPKDRALRFEDVKSAVAEEGILALAFADNTLLEYIRTRIRPEQFSSSILAHIYQRALEIYDMGNLVTLTAFEGELDDGAMSLLSALLSRPETTMKREQALDDYIHLIAVQRARREAADNDETGESLEEFTRCQREKKSFGGNRV